MRGFFRLAETSNLQTEKHDGLRFQKGSFTKMKFKKDPVRLGGRAFLAAGTLLAAGAWQTRPQLPAQIPQRIWVLPSFRPVRQAASGIRTFTLFRL